MRKPQGVASLALGWVLHWAFSPRLLNPKVEFTNYANALNMACPLHQSLQQSAKRCGAPRLFECQHRPAVWRTNTHFILCISARACTLILYFVKLSALCTFSCNCVDNQCNT